MARARKAVHDFDVDLGTAGMSAEGIRRARRSLLELDKERTRENRSIVRELRLLRASYRDSVGELIGPSGMRQLRKIHSNRSNVSRARIIRQTNALLKELEIDRTRLEPLQRRYLDDARALVSRRDELIRARHRFNGRCESPWVTYIAPFSGYFWSFAWERSSNPADPVLIRHLDIQTSRIGSSIEAKLSGADNDDFLTAEYYTGLNIWHTALAAGTLEVYLGFEFNASTYSGKVKDEFGFSSATYHQWTGARLLVVDSQGASEAQVSRIFSFIGTDWGDGDSWTNYAEKPRDLHWYHFRTAASFEQGDSMLLEAGIENLTWFHADDESVTTSDNIDLRLDRIIVRSCRADPIL